MKILTAIFIALLLLSGCASQKRMVVVEKKSMPLWYTNPPLSDSAQIYATGEGENKEEAIKNALNTMASMLSVSLSSSFNSTATENQGLINNYQKTISSEIQSDVKKIRISNYEIINSVEQGFKEHLVLLKSNKSKLFESLKKELEIKFDIVEKRKKNMLSLNAIKQLNIYKELKTSLSDVANTLVVMDVLKSGFDGRSYIDKTEQVSSEYEVLLSKITFSIHSNKEAKNLESSIADGLSSKNMQIKNISNKEHFKINIKSKSEKANSYGFTLARCAINITVEDHLGKIIGSNKLNIIGQSTQGYNIAKENVAIKLNAMIEKDGISKVIGLEL